jgi:histidinol phosphatase-like PHP family hydrolase
MLWMRDARFVYICSFCPFQDRHWHTIFLGMNEPYVNTAQFTVADLMAYSLTEHADLIHSVYLSAVAEYDLEQQMSKIRRLWQDKNFKLAKHIPDSMFVKGVGLIE